MDKTAAGCGEDEDIAASAWLVMTATDASTEKMTQQQRPHAAMPDEQHIARNSTFQYDIDFTDDAPLGIDCPLPTPYADLWPSKKRIGGLLELRGRQEAGG